MKTPSNAQPSANPQPSPHLRAPESPSPSFPAGLRILPRMVGDLPQVLALAPSVQLELLLDLLSPGSAQRTIAVQRGPAEGEAQLLWREQRVYRFEGLSDDEPLSDDGLRSCFLEHLLLSLPGSEDGREVVLSGFDRLMTAQLPPLPPVPRDAGHYLNRFGELLAHRRRETVHPELLGAMLLVDGLAVLAALECPCSATGQPLEDQFQEFTVVVTRQGAVIIDLPRGHFLRVPGSQPYVQLASLVGELFSSGRPARRVRLPGISAKSSQCW